MGYPLGRGAVGEYGISGGDYQRVRAPAHLRGVGTLGVGPYLTLQRNVCVVVYIALLTLPYLTTQPRHEIDRSQY